jgi:nucleotide-binding universal stress UspA family protein
MMRVYKRILVPPDGSTLAEQALPHAIALAESFPAELILFRALNPVASTLNLPPGAVKRSEEITKELASEYLDQVAGSNHKSNVSITPVIVVGRPDEEITSSAEPESVDLVVMCTRGHFGVSRWLMGSVADRVTRSIVIKQTCPNCKEQVAFIEIHTRQRLVTGQPKAKIAVILCPKCKKIAWTVSPIDKKLKKK